MCVFLNRKRICGIQIHSKAPRIRRSMRRRQIRLQVARIRCIGRYTCRAPACALTCVCAGAHVHAGFHADGVETGEVVGFGAAEIEAAVEAELGFYGGGGCVEGEAVRVGECQLKVLSGGGDTDVVVNVFAVRLVL